MIKKCIGLVLATTLTLSVVACGQSDSEVESHIPPPATSSTSTVEEEVSENNPLNAAYLTGLEKGPDYPEGQRVIGVMVNNIIASRPTSGLSEASVVYEMRVEGGITRFMAIYEDYTTMPKVGSVRSARDQFFQLLVPSFGFYLHDGPNQNQPVIQMIQDQEYEEFDLTPDLGISWRDPDRSGMPLEYTEYTDGETVAAAVEEYELDDERTYNSTMFAFTPYNEEPRVLEGGAAPTVGVVHSESYRNLFEYDASTNRYMMSQFDSTGMTPAIDENNNEQLGFNNLLVLFTVMHNYPDSELVQVGFDSGIGYYFNGGNYELVRWKKGGPLEPLRIYVNDTNETTNYINPGNTYIALIDDIYLEDFDASVQAGTGDEMASDGTINPNETETED